jgi:hypothetical protein
MNLVEDFLNDFPIQKEEVDQVSGKPTLTKNYKVTIFTAVETM